MIQAYPLPTSAGLTNNQFTNPVLGQNNDTGDGRIDWNLNANNTIFGRFSRQDTLTNTPSTFGFRTVPGLSIPVSLGNSTNYAGRAPMNNYNDCHCVYARVQFDISGRYANGIFALCHA